MADIEETAELITQLQAKAIVEAYRAGKEAGKAERDRLLEVLKEVQECSAYWSEYYVPIGIHDRIQAAIASVESLQEDRDE